uniref:Nanos homolog 1 n=1 Tax=Astyanax mexicanus TaxID=7994 RepID=A0A3B1IP82_ASTMX
MDVARASYDYTFNFWNDYLGLSTLVTKSNSKRGAAPGPNSITESLKATLGLDDPAPCACAQPDCSCCCCCCAPASPPPASLLELKERFSVLSPFGARLERDAEPKICVFCRNNGAPEEVYGSHVLKTPEGRVVCPILRAYTCPLCSANGDNAHTIKYCPLSKEQPAQRALKGGRAVGGKRVKLF